MAKRSRKKSNKSGLLCFLLIVLVCASGYFVYTYNNTNNVKLGSNKTEEEEKKPSTDSTRKNTTNNSTNAVNNQTKTDETNNSNSNTQNNTKNTTTKTETVQSSVSDNKKKIEYDQKIVASGFSGANDNVYYTKNKSLYHLIISTNETEKLADGVDSIEAGLDGLTAYTNSSFKQYKEDTYVTYVSR